MTSPTFYKFLRSTLIASALVFMPMYAFAATYYMAPAGSDSNSGSLSAPWKSYTRAQSTLKPGDTLYARGGTYGTASGYSYQWTVSGTAAAPITFAAYPGETPVFDGAWQGGEFLIFDKYAYIVVDGLTMQHYANPSGNGTVLIFGTSHHITIQNNHFVDNGTDSFDHHIYLANGSVHDITIRNNIFDHAAGAAIHFYHYQTPSHVFIYNNLIINNVNWGVLLADGCDDVQIFNNTFYNNGENPTSNNYNASISTDHGETSNICTNILIKNNIFYTKNNGKGLIVGSTNSPNTTEDYNAFYSEAGGSAISWSGHTMGAHSISANPQFMTVGSDFHLKSTSPAINKGSTLSLVTTDKDGVARPQGSAYDIGAYEYKGTVTTSAPAVSLSPTSLNFGAVPVGTVSTIQLVTVTNTGTAALTITNSALTGDYAFGGTGTCVTGNSYAPGASCTESVKFTPTVSGTRTGTLTITDNAAGSPHVVQLSGGVTNTGITALTNGVVLTNLSAATNAQKMYQITVPAGATNLRFVTSGGAGDIDLFVKFGSQPTMTVYDAKSVGNTTAETISIPTPQAGTYYLLTNGWAAYSGVSLVGAYTPAVTSGPVASLSPTSLNFGSVNLGNSSTIQLVTVTNTGNAALTITNSALTGDFSFGGTGTCVTGNSYAPGASCTDSVKFTPTVNETRTGTLTVTDNAAGSPHVVLLTGTGGTTPAPILSLAPASLSFGSVPVGTASTPQALTLTNTGTANLSFTAGFAFTGDFNGSGNCSSATPLVPGANCVLNVTFTPTVSGTRTGTVTITTNAAGSPNIVSLSGGVTNTGITALTNGVVLTNLSAATNAQKMYQITVPAGATNLRFVTSGGAGDIDLFVKFGSQPTMTVYDAKSVGNTTAETISIPTPQAGTYYLLTNGWAAYSGVSLVGAYTATVTSAPAVSLSPTSLNFGSVIVGNSSTIQLVTVTNTGTAALTITNSALTGDFAFGGTGTCSTGVSYAPGASCTDSVKFTPTVSGTRTGTLTITDNAANSPQVVQLTGTGGGTTGDTIAPTVAISAPLSGATVSGTAVAVAATASDNIGVVGVQFKFDGANFGTEDTSAPYGLTWNTTATANGSHTITAVARDAAGNTKTSTAVMVTVQNTVASGNNLYVATNGLDSNSGTQTSPFHTIGKAASVAVPNTTIHVAPGTYIGSITTSVSGTASGRIRFVSDVKWGAKLVPVKSNSASGTYGGDFWTNTGSYIDIQDFEVVGSDNPTIRMGIANQGGYVRIIGNHVHHFIASLEGGMGGAGILSCGSGCNYTDTRTNEVSGNVIHDIGDMNHQFRTTGVWTVHGIYISNPNAKVFNNIAYHNESYGIHLHHSPLSAIVTNNTSFNNLGGGFYYNTGSTNTGGAIIRNNIAFDNKGVDGHGGGIDVNNGGIVTYSNNLVFQNAKSNTYGAIAADPQFVTYVPTGGGDYHLKSTSPAVNAGTSLNAPTTDMDGIARPQGGGYDIGAYER